MMVIAAATRAMLMSLSREMSAVQRFRFQQPPVYNILNLLHIHCAEIRQMGFS